MPAAVETMMYNEREVPWHGLGNSVEGAVDSEEALVKAGLLWGVFKEPMYLRDGTEIPDRVAIVRSTDQAILGTVGNRYRPVQNAEAFRWVDALLGEGVRYETAGSLRGGKRVWLLAVLPEQVKVAGDVVEPYLCFTNSHDGSSAVKAMLTPIRVVCNNTLSVAIRGATRSWKCAHVASIGARMEQARQTLGLAQNYMERLKEDGEAMARTKMDFEKAVKQLIQVNSADGDKAKRNKDLQIQDIRLRLGADDLVNHKGTAWGFFQAVADHVTHAEPVRETKTWRERRWENLMEGDDLLNKAREIALAAN